MTKKKIKYTLEQRAQDFVMALREPLMEYYKGTCVDNLNATSNSHGIRFNRHSLEYDHRGQNRAFNYERREHDIINPMRVYFHSSPLMDIRHEPDKATLFIPVFKRSPELTEVLKQLRRFYDSYLPGVELVDDTSEEWSGYTVPMEDSSITVAGRYIPELDRDTYSDDDLDDDLTDRWVDHPVPESLQRWANASLRGRPAEWSGAAVQTVYFDEAVQAVEAMPTPEVEPTTAEEPSTEWTTLSMGNTLYDVNRRTSEIRNIRSANQL